VSRRRHRPATTRLLNQTAAMTAQARSYRLGASALPMLLLVIVIAALWVFPPVRRHFVIGSPCRSIFVPAAIPLRCVGIVLILLSSIRHVTVCVGMRHRWAGCNQSRRWNTTQADRTTMVPATAPSPRRRHDRSVTTRAACNAPGWPRSTRMRPVQVSSSSAPESVRTES
jgi:hypothetical protein